ncbi:MAG: hypothetical protein WAV16_01720 [Candidatus Moraniibacteriota bacterium]
MQTIQSIMDKIQPGGKILFETPAMKDRFVQGATVLKVDDDKLVVETQGREQILEAGTRISIVA